MSLLKTMKALEGIKVLELSGQAGAAFCGRLLGSQGAEVVRVHPHGGPLPEADESPQSRGDDLYLSMYKTQSEIDLTAAAGPRQLRDVIDDMDVVLTDLPQAALRSLGVHWGELRSALPRLIYTTLSVFGAAGPNADWIGTDLEAQAFGGLMSQIGWPDSSPLSIPYDGALLHAGEHAAGATVAALLKRHWTGEGSLVDISAAQAVAANVRNYSLLLRFYDIPLKRAGRRAPGSLGRYPAAIFPCKDGYVVMTARSGRQWRAIIEMLGSPDWGQDPRYHDAYGVAVEYPDEVDALVIPALMEHTREELGEMARAHHVPLGPVLTLSELIDDEQLAFRNFWVEVETERGVVRLPSDPLQWRSPEELSCQ